nr:retrotransposon protein, putative, Ty1-copia subclass [Tanacetum cinerariifolium]
MEFVGNGVRAQVDAIRSYDLVLPNGLVIYLDNCHYAPFITRSVVLVSCLVENGFVQRFTDYGISVSRNDVLYFNAIPSNGIYEIDMSNYVPNVNSIYNVSNKRVKHNLDSTYLWHCRLAHISKKRIGKLQHDGLLKSTDDESFDQCMSCLSGKMTRKSFPHRLERATDLLGLIHTDVCGPLRHVSRQEVEEHSLGDLNEPANYKAAMLNPESNKWLDAMNAKMQSMKDNQVWRLVDLPPNGKTVGSKWLFKKKTDMDGNAHTYKARLVEKEFTQTYGVDYEETFSPVADIRAIRILIAIAAFYDYEIWQMDVKTAFLNGYLDEDIYMVQPECFIDPKHPRKARKPQRSIYGLKQASRSWNKRFDEEIKKSGFTQNLDEPCVYQKMSGSNVRFLILMDNSKRGYIPMQERLDLNKTQGASTLEDVKRMQNVPYASAVGSIMYAIRCTRPDVAFVQNITSCFQQNPVDWKSSKQSTTAMSAIEAEYIAASEAGTEVVFIRKFISGLGLVPTINKPIRMFCDNSAALHFANEPGVQRGARHFHRKYHYVREYIKLGEIKFLKVHTDDNLADPFMKALSNKRLTQHARSMGLHLASSFM